MGVRSRKVGASVATVALVGCLSTGMVAMDAKPAEAFVWIAAPLLIGGTGLTMAGVTAVTGTAVSWAAGLALTGLAIGGTVLALDSMKSIPITEPGVEPVPSGSPGVTDRIVSEPQPLTMRFEGWDGTNIRQATNLNEIQIDASNAKRIDKGYQVQIHAKSRCQPFDVTKPEISSEMESVSGMTLYPEIGWTGGTATFTVCPAGHRIVESVITAPTPPQRINEYWGPRGDHVFKGPGWAVQGGSYYIATAHCVGPGGTDLGTVQASTPVDQGWLNIPSCKAAGKGENSDRMDVELFQPSRPSRKIFTITPEKDQYLNCDPALGQVCRLTVEIDGVPCTRGAVECVNWAEIKNISPARVQCKYGGNVVPISNCNLIEKQYTTTGTIPVADNVDGDPATSQDPKTIPGPAYNPTPGYDPAADPVPDTPTNPNPETPPYDSPQPEPSPSPSVSPPPETAPGTSTPPTTGTNPTGPNPGGDNCMGAGWSWNPVSWVMVPVQCAMQWAFVPKVDVQTRITNMQGKFSDKAPVSWFGGNVANVSGGACPSSWAITVAGERVPFICGTPVEGIILGFRPYLAGMLIVAALWPLVRSLFYSSIPVLKVNPS